MRKYLSLHFLVLAATVSLTAQSDYVTLTPEKKPEPSLAEQARKAVKPSTVKAKTVFTNDNLHVQEPSPFPMIRLEQDDSDAIVKSMIKYRSFHTAKETEEAIHKWFDVHDGKLSDMMNESRQIREREASRYYYPQSPDTDYKRAMARQRSEMLSAQNDQQILTNNYKFSQRITSTLQRVSYGLRGANLVYDWFVVRNSYDIY